jgi:hypothetical protein
MTQSNASQRAPTYDALTTASVELEDAARRYRSDAREIEGRQDSDDTLADSYRAHADQLESVMRYLDEVLRPGAKVAELAEQGGMQDAHPSK